jgi:hypothetical protein
LSATEAPFHVPVVENPDPAGPGCVVDDADELVTVGPIS